MTVSVNTRLGAIANTSYILAQSAIPMILPSSGTIGNNGALSGLTALPATYASCYMYFPANAIAAGVAAGLYYVVMSSTTAGTIYNNVYSGEVPQIPASPTAFMTTGPGAYTQTTSSTITLESVTIPANTMGNNGAFRIIKASFSINNSANNKSVSVMHNSTTILGKTRTTTVQESFGPYTVSNRGVANRQIAASSNYIMDGNTAGASSYYYGTIDTSITSTLNATASIASAADFIVCESLIIEVLPS